MNCVGAERRPIPRWSREWPDWPPFLVGIDFIILIMMWTDKYPAFFLFVCVFINNYLISLAKAGCDPKLGVMTGKEAIIVMKIGQSGFILTSTLLSSPNL